MTTSRLRGSGSGPALLAAAVAVVLLLAPAVPASAHAAFVSSQPEPGAQLSTTPGVVVLRFSEPLIEDLSRASVEDPNGEVFEGTASGERQIRVRLATNATGEYTVSWTTVSPIDGHTLHGEFRFGVGVDVGAQAEPSSAPTASDLAVAAARVLEYVGLLGTLGWLTIGALARRRELDWVPSGLHRWVVLGAAGGVLVVGGEVLLAGGASLGGTLQAFLAAPSGVPRLLRLATELLVVAVVVASRRRHEEREAGPVARWWAGALTTVVLLLLATSGHAAGVRPAIAGILADGLHLVAAGVWAGSIGVMALHRPPGGWRGDHGRDLLASFPRVAVPAFVATVVLGSVRGLQELAHLSDLWRTGYGQVLAAKVALVAAMLPLSWRGFQADRPRPRAEAVLGVAVVAAAAVLAAFPVPPGRAEETADVGDEQVATDALPRPGDLTLARGAGETVVGLTLRPGEPGSNDVYVHLVPVAGEETAGGLRTTLTVDGGRTVTMEPCGAPCRVATVTLQGGETVAVAIDGDPPASATFALPGMPAQDGRALLEALRARMDGLDRWTFTEQLGPADPPVASRWALSVPGRLWGAVDNNRGRYYETLRIEERRWRREDPDAPWELQASDARPLGRFPFIWDYDATAPRIVGSDELDGVPTRILSFHADAGGTAIWYRLWVDDDDLVRRAEMLAQGHFMDRDYADFDAPLRIEPPPAGYQPP